MPYKDPEVGKARRKAYKESNKEAKRIYDKAYREVNSETRKAQDQAYYEANREVRRERVLASQKLAPLKYLLTGAKGRAVKKGLEFSLTEEDFSELPTHCPVLGVELQYGGGMGRGPRPNSASIDRIDSSRGYVSGNVAIISHRANSIKRDATLEEVYLLTKYMELHATQGI
jgi:hypothetical protein